jgi:hypothetical protein
MDTNFVDFGVSRNVLTLLGKEKSFLCLINYAQHEGLMGGGGAEVYSHIF